MRTILVSVTIALLGCAARKPLPACPEPGPPDHVVVPPEELELPEDDRMPAGTKPPAVIVSPPPELPPDAFEKAETPQAVVVKYRVDERGRVASTEVTRGQPPFSDAAVAAVRRMRFEPAEKDGEPIAVYQMRRFVFRASYAHCQDHTP